jgi:elongation factor G
VRGILAGFPLVDFKVELYDGSYHTVDSNEMSFKMAGILAFKAVATKCKPVLLEPLDEIEVLVPDEYMGDVLGDLSSRRGHIQGTDAVEDAAGAMTGYTRIKATVPQAELHLYASTLQSMTQGRATYHKKFRGYEEAPNDFAQKVIAEHAKVKDEELVGA